MRYLRNSDFHRRTEEEARAVSKHVTANQLLLRTTLLNDQKFKCAYCGKDIKNDGNTHMDHVIPQAIGGSDDISNLKAVCKGCNHSKGATNLENFRIVVWFRKKFATSQKFTPAQIRDLDEMGFFSSIPKERHWTGFKFYFETLEQTPF